MRVEVRLAQLSMGMSDAEILEWIAGEGAHVIEGDDLVEIAAEKAQMMIPAPATGTVVDIRAQVGDTVEVQGLLCSIDTSAA